MFENIDEVLHLVEGTYKKLKLFYYYDKTLLYIKASIAEFEADSNFKDRLKELATAISQKNEKYFDNLIKKLDFVVLPKTFKSHESDEHLIRGNTDKNKNVSKINFYISLPIELLIIDLMWTLFIKKIWLSSYGEFMNSYAGRFKKTVFTEDYSLIKGIDFDSNRCFEPYYESYIEWRNKALDTISHNSSNKDIVLFSLDLKSFYYTVNFDFKELDEKFSTDNRYLNITYITNIIKKIYMCYTKKILQYKKGIKVDNQKNILPIGLISPVVLREVSLKKIDDKILNKLQPLYYGRYVDDILIVLEVINMQRATVDILIDDILIKNEIILPANKDGDYCFYDRSTIKLQREKINCFFFERGKENILVDVYNKTIRKASSEANLLPDIDLLSQSFNCRAYAMGSGDSSGKVRNLEFMKSDNYNATLFVNGLKRIIKNTTYDSKNINKYLDDIMEFYSGSQAIEFSNSWRSVFELLILCKDKNRANAFYINIKKAISDLSFEDLDEKELYKAKKDVVLKRLKRNLLRKLDEAIALAISLDYKRGVKKHISLAKKIRSANMLNHSMVSFPLINYLNDNSIEYMSLINTNIDDILKSITDKKELFRLDNEKVKWSPRFIHLDELYFYIFYYSIANGKSLIRNDNDKIFNKYKKMNNLPEKISAPIKSDKEVVLHGINIIRKDILINAYKNYGKTRIGLVNTNLTEKSVMNCLVNPKEGITDDKKQRLFKILNLAKEERVDYLVFPEFYMPAIWLSDITKFAKQYGITIITGMKYVVLGKKVHNMVCVISSIREKNKFRHSIPLFREKNYYAPDEKLHLVRLGYECKDKTIPYYYLITNGVESFSTILCYEFTDIASRLAMKAKIEMLFVPQLNRDTNYFASIVESAARDLHCFVIQANTSIYGDSRITAPFKTDYKDLVKIKGGVNELLIVGELDIPELVNYKANYYSKYNKLLDRCSNCNRVKNISDIELKCIKCKENIKKAKIKGLPPHIILRYLLNSCGIAVFHFFIKALILWIQNVFNTFDKRKGYA